MTKTVTSKKGHIFVVDFIADAINKVIHSKAPIERSVFINSLLYDFYYHDWINIITPKLSLTNEKDKEYWQETLKWIFLKEIGR